MTIQGQLQEWLRDRTGNEGTFNEDFLVFLNSFVRENNFKFYDDTNFVFYDTNNFVFIDEIGYSEGITFNEKLYLYLQEQLNVVGDNLTLTDLQNGFAKLLGFDRWQEITLLSGNKNFSFTDGNNFIFYDTTNFNFYK